MANVLIRGLSEEALARIDSESASLGLSRNEYLRRKLEEDATARPRVALTDFDWQRSADVFVDLADAEVMDAAWR